MYPRPGSRGARTRSATEGGRRRLSHTNDFCAVSSPCSSASGIASTGARRAAARTGSPTTRGCAKSDSADAEVASGAPRRSTIEPRSAVSVIVREYWRSASAASSACRTSCRWPSRDTTPPNATASTAARISTRVRSAGGITPETPSPDHALRAQEARRREATRAAREVLARQPYLLAARHGHAELPRAGLDATGRAERGDLDLELPQQHLGPDPLAAKGVELVGEVHLLHAKTDHHAEPHHEEGGAEQGHGERAPQARIGITMETLMSLH